VHPRGIVAGLVEVEVGAVIPLLAGEFVMDTGGRIETVGSNLPIRGIGERLVERARAGGNHGAAAQMIGVVVLELGGGLQGDPVIPGKDIAGTRAGLGAFIELADVDRGGPAHDLFDPPPVAVVDEGGKFY